MIQLESSHGIAYFDWGGTNNKGVIHFAHGNGFPPESYRSFIEPFLSQYSVISWECFGSTFPIDASHLTHWGQLAGVFSAFLRNIATQPTILMGHSFGAVISLLAHLEHQVPAEKLVLIDPVIFNPFFCRLMMFIRWLPGLSRYAGPIARQARRKRDRWKNREALVSAYRHKALFKNWEDASFEAYVDAIITPARNGVTIRYEKEWEADIYETTAFDIWRRLKRGRRIASPLLMIRGMKSNACFHGACTTIHKEVPGATVIELQGVSHCIPMEQPKKLSTLVLDFL